MAKRSLSQLDVTGQRVLVRVDFNIPIEPGIEAIAGYDQRLRATLPTIRHLIGQDCRTILCSHIGRPQGKVDNALRLSPIGDRLAHLLSPPVLNLTLSPSGQLTGPGNGSHPGGNRRPFRRRSGSAAVGRRCPGRGVEYRPICRRHSAATGTGAMGRGRKLRKLEAQVG